MVGVSSPGIGSGLDISTIVSSLVAAEIQPKTIRLDQREAGIQTEISSIGQLKSALSAMQSSMSGLMTMSGFQSRNANLSDTSVITASAESTAVVGNYQVEVEQLATQHSLSSASFTDSNQAVGSGSITFEFGSYDAGPTTFTPNPDKSAKTITISSTNNTLAAIRDSINAADAGVTAAILQDGNGSRLVFSSDDSGANNALKITVDDDDLIDNDNAGLSQLTYDPVGGTAYMTQNIAAQDSQVKINGLTLNNPSNKLDQSIEGVTINLLTAKPGSTINLDVTNNTGAALAKVSSFVSSYNDVMSTLDVLSNYDAETEVAGPMQGDANLRGLKLQLRRMIADPVAHLDGDIRALSISESKPVKMAC